MAGIFFSIFYLLSIKSIITITTIYVYAYAYIEFFLL